MTDLILIADPPDHKWFDEFEMLIDEILAVADFVKCAQARVDKTADWREAMKLQKSVDDLNGTFVETIGEMRDAIARVPRPKLSS